MSTDYWKPSLEGDGLRFLGEVFHQREDARTWLFDRLEDAIAQMRADDPEITEAAISLMRNEGRILCELAVNQSWFPQPPLPRTAGVH
jgi:hypothetical protein